MHIKSDLMFDQAIDFAKLTFWSNQIFGKKSLAQDTVKWTLKELVEKIMLLEAIGEK